MNSSFAPTPGLVPSPAHQAPAQVAIPQYGMRRILAVWAAAALPMGALAWLVAPALKDSFAGTGSVQMAKALIVCFAAGLIWQFVLVVALLRREQGTLRWSTTREALWLRSPQSPHSGRVGGRNWLILVPLILVAAVFDGVPIVNGPSNRDFGTFIGSHAGHAFLSGAWGWYALILVMLLFNTVLGEELLFRGFLLPRMNRAFGRGDWLANGVCSPCTTCTSRGRCRPRCSTRSSTPTRPSATEAHGSASPSTAPQACSSAIVILTLVA